MPNSPDRPSRSISPFGDAWEGSPMVHDLSIQAVMVYKQQAPHPESISGQVEAFLAAQDRDALALYVLAVMEDGAGEAARDVARDIVNALLEGQDRQ